MYICQLPKPWREELEKTARARQAYTPDFHDSRFADVLEAVGLEGWKLWHLSGPVYKIWKRFGLYTVDVGYHSISGRWSVIINRHHLDGLIAQSQDVAFFDTLHDAVQVYEVMEALECLE